MSYQRQKNMVVYLKLQWLQINCFNLKVLIATLTNIKNYLSLCFLLKISLWLWVYATKLNNLLWELLSTGSVYDVYSLRFVCKIKIYIICYFSVISFFPFWPSLFVLCILIQFIHFTRGGYSILVVKHS